jgi:TolA-binding protein
MGPRTWLALVAGCSVLVAAPVAAAQPDTVTATGTGQHAVQPKNRKDNASIAAAYDAAAQLRPGLPAGRPAERRALEHLQRKQGAAQAQRRNLRAEQLQDE